MMLNGNRTKSNRGRSPRDLYITPPELAEVALDEIIINKKFDYVLDAGCGTGNWGKRIGMVSNYFIGLDLQPNISDENKYFYDEIISSDFLKFNVITKFDLILGNPPYSLAEEFIRHSFELLVDKGYIYFLLRLSFLEGIARRKERMFEQLKRVYVCVRRPSFFSSHGNAHTTDSMAYAMFLWQKGYTGKTELSFLDWEYKK